MRKLIAVNLALAVLAGAPLAALGQMVRFDSKPGSKIRMEGTSTMHDWQVEGKLIGGYMEVGQNFPTEPGQEAKPGKVDAKVEAFIPIRSMTSLKKDGSPYSTAMDDIMYEKLKSPRITYRLTELVLKEPAKSKDAPHVFDATGELVVAGATNKITMPVNITPLGDKKLKVSGTTNVKMTSFGIEPPAPTFAGGLIKTGDDVKLIIDWNVAQRATAAAAK
ncbi:MAG TPA: YceI family protein [Clostridia bacterium]|nr:YceI family protein [Clostridia bacterium]